MKSKLPLITPNLWFDTEAEEAATFYTSIFHPSRFLRITRYGREGKDIHGKDAREIMTVEFELDGQNFVALNGGPQFSFNEAISFIINCETQEEIDYYWEKLSEGGDPAAQRCGWLKDKFGLSWQVVPTILDELTSDPNMEKSDRVVKALLQMKKIDISALQKAYEGKAISG